MEILIVKTSAIGDVTHTLPALNAIRKRYPEARITWLVEEAAADVVIGHKSLDRVLVSRRKKWSENLFGRHFFTVLAEARQFLRELRDTRYDLLIDFQGLLKSGIFVALAKAERKVGFGRGMEHAECSWIFLNERVPAVDMNIHALDRELMLLKAIGVECDDVCFDFPVTEEDRKIVDRIFDGSESSDKKIVAINPLATWTTKLWDNDKFADVAGVLLGKGMRVVFTGGPSDKQVIDELITKHDLHEAVNVAGSTSIKELAALYQRADLLITTDTGPMHIAVAVGTPVVAIFGPTAPWRTGPYGNKNQVIRAKLECSPCLKKDCETMECMMMVGVEEVLKGVEHAQQNAFPAACCGVSERI